MSQPLGGERDTVTQLRDRLAVGERTVRWQDVRGNSGQQRAAFYG
jgi:hypothetical protein